MNKRELSTGDVVLLKTPDNEVFDNCIGVVDVPTEWGAMVVVRGFEKVDPTIHLGKPVRPIFKQFRVIYEEMEYIGRIPPACIESTPKYESGDKSTAAGLNPAAHPIARTGVVLAQNAQDFVQKSPSHKEESALAAKKVKGEISGEFCKDCGGSNMMRSGTCLTCTDCGSTSGGCS